MENPEYEKKPSTIGMQRLGEAIMNQIDYHVAEYDLTYDQVIGGLEILKLNMYHELLDDTDEEEDKEDEP